MLPPTRCTQPPARARTPPPWQVGQARPRRRHRLAAPVRAMPAGGRDCMRGPAARPFHQCSLVEPACLPARLGHPPRHTSTPLRTLAGLMLEGLEEWEIQPDEIVLGPRIGIGRCAGAGQAGRAPGAIRRGLPLPLACSVRHPPFCTHPHHLPCPAPPDCSFGEVYRGIWRQTDVAVKRLLDQEVSQQMLAEVRHCSGGQEGCGGGAAAAGGNHAWVWVLSGWKMSAARMRRHPAPHR